MARTKTPYNETIQWHSVGDELPDAETTVLVQAPTLEEPVWLGWYDGCFWFAVDATDYEDGQVVAWAHIPTGMPTPPPP